MITSGGYGFHCAVGLAEVIVGNRGGGLDNAFQVMLGPVLQGVAPDPSMYHPSSGQKRDQSIGG